MFITSTWVARAVSADPFLISQLLAAMALGSDLLSFQLKQRRHILACLAVSSVLIGAHFLLLQKYTAAVVSVVAVARFIACYFSTSRWLMTVFIALFAAIAALTWHGPLSLLSSAGAIIATVGSFSASDRRLRELLIASTLVWTLHNALAHSPVAVALELLFLASNLLGYYRFYLRPAQTECS